METLKHTHAGNQILIEGLEESNYMQGGDFEGTQISPLEIQMMRLNENDLPEPTDLKLTSGQVTALSGDYFTIPGWGMKLSLPKDHDKAQSHYPQSAKIAVSQDEVNLYQQVYATLTAPTVTSKTVAKIYGIEDDFERNPTTFKQYSSQLQYIKTVPHYLDALQGNEAHFAPWSTRAYIVGHHSALQHAETTYELKQLADNPTAEVSKRTQEVVAKIKASQPSDANLKSVYKDYADRFHTLAVGMD